MTAIAYVYTSEGFVIGADGRGCSPEGDCLTDHVTKLHPISGPKINLICGMAGATWFKSKDGVLNLSSEAEHIVNDLAKVMPDIEQLVPEFTGRIVEWFEQKCIRLDETVTRSLFVGFAKNLPVCWEIKICSEPCCCARPIDQTYWAFSGPQSVFEDLNRNGCLPEPDTLEKGKEGISRYLASCFERETNKYGGQTHIAAIPRTRRVEWMIPPEGLDGTIRA